MGNQNTNHVQQVMIPIPVKENCGEEVKENKDAVQSSCSYLISEETPDMKESLRD